MIGELCYLSARAIPIIAPGFIPGLIQKQPLRDPDPIRVRFRAWARNRTRMSEEGRLAGRFPRDESRGLEFLHLWTGEGHG